MKKIIAFLLCIMLMFSFMGTAFAAESGGSFVLAAFTANKTVIEPVRIPYKSGQTIREALLATDYEFVGLEQGFIYEIDGNEAGYTLFYDQGEYDLERDASEITALWIGVNITYSEDTHALLLRMAEYRDMQNNVQKYPAAGLAYLQALDGIRRNLDTAALKQKLDDAIAEYEELLNGEKYTVTLAATQGSNALIAPNFTLTDAYGNVTSVTGNTAQVIAGEYTFCVSDGGYNRTEGKLTVDGAKALSVTLPSGEWFGEVRLLNGAQQPYRSQTDAGKHTAKFWIEDTARELSSVYLNVGMGAVPDEDMTRLRSIYVGTNGIDLSDTKRSWESVATALTYLVSQGMEGKDFSIEAQYDDANGHTQIQSYEMSVERIPTLSELQAVAEGTVLPLEFDPETYAYELTTVADQLEIQAKGMGADYTITGAGSVAVSADTIQHVVRVEAAGARNEYTLNITKKEAVDVTLTVPAGVTVAVKNAAGAEIAPVNGVYRLIPGEAYTYTATKNTYYHTEQTFTASAGLQINVASPDTADQLKGLALYNGKNVESRIAYETDDAFAPAKHTYTYRVSDCNSSLYMQATSSETATALYHTQRTWPATHNLPKEVTVKEKVSETGNATALQYAVAKSGYGQEITLRLSHKNGEVTYYQDYFITLARELHLSDMSLATAEETLNLTDKDGGVQEFDRDIKEYYVQVNRDVESLVLSGAFPNPGGDTDICGGYSMLIGGETYTELENVEIALNTELYQEDLVLQIRHKDSRSIGAEYVIHVSKTDPVKIQFRTTPENAVIYLKNNLNGKRVYDENGIFALTPGGSYTYTVTCAGYVGTSASYTAPQQDGTMTITLEKAAENPALKKLNAAWPSFRADENNNGVVSAKTPVKAEEAVLSWATKIGSGFDKNACGCPIIVDGALYTYAGTTLYKVDTVSGEILATGEMDHASSFAINPPTYADGMIFIGLADGTVQAFNAATLESLWIYRDELKGQPNCPIVYHNGYVYTGFWVGETSDANYICINATDEDPSNPKESKLATWSYTTRGGFYWAGSYVCDEYLLIGTDDGESGYLKGRAKVLSLNPTTGKPIDEMTMPVAGDIRSSITKSDGKYNFTSKGGYFFEMTVKNDGTLEKLRTLKLYNYASEENAPAMSTCTPTIYRGRAYVGASGTSQFGAYSGHNITVIDIANWEIAYTVRTQGYPQTSGILTTAYEKDTGSVYVYFFDNFTPGKLRVLEDKPGQTSPSMVSVETYVDKGTTKTFETAYNLFQPDGAHAQYAICSPIVDEYGTIYFKNDSAYLMAVSSAVTELEVTVNPEKMSYAEGEIFDGKGMEVTAHYANGLTRDVTKYVTWSEEPLTAEDTDFQIEFPYALYQNYEGQSGVEYIQPHAVLTLEISGGAEVLYGDVDGNGTVTAKDAGMIYSCVNGKITFTDEQILAADVDGNGAVTAKDAGMVYSYVNAKLEQFPVEKN